MVGERALQCGGPPGRSGRCIKSIKIKKPGAEAPGWLRPTVQAAAFLASLASGSPLISIRRGRAALEIGALISSTPFLYSADRLLVSTPSGSVTVRSKAP